MWKLLLGWVIICIVILTIWNFFCVPESSVINWWNKRREKRKKQQQEKAKQLEKKKICDHTINEEQNLGPSYADARYFAVDLERGQQQIQSRHENAKGNSAFSARKNGLIHLLSQRINELERQQNRMQAQQQQKAPSEPTGQQQRRQFPPSPHIFWPSQSQPTLSTIASISTQQNAGANDGPMEMEEMQPNWPNEQDREGSIHFQSARSSPLPPSLPLVSACSSQWPQSTSNEKCADDVPMESSLPPVPAWSSQSQQSTSNDNCADNVPIENQWESGDTWGQASGNELLCTQCSAKIKNEEEQKEKKEEQKELNERDEYSFESNVRKIGPLSQKILKNMDSSFARFPEDRHKICPICRDPFGVAQPVTRSDCGFLFHYNCISRWFLVCRICPICRNIVGRKDITDKEDAKAKKKDNDAW